MTMLTRDENGGCGDGGCWWWGGDDENHEAKFKEKATTAVAG